MIARDRPLAAYYSHHKCATMYVTGVLDRVCRECGWSFWFYHDRRAFGGDPPGRLGSGPSDVVAYVNAEWEQVEALGDVPAFHVIRDPRDIWVSAYFSHLGPHPTDRRTAAAPPAEPGSRAKASGRRLRRPLHRQGIGPTTRRGGPDEPLPEGRGGRLAPAPDRRASRALPRATSGPAAEDGVLVSCRTAAGAPDRAERFAAPRT